MEEIACLAGVKTGRDLMIDMGSFRAQNREI
jgi:hypothetical protein